eukprot:c7587_g1_i1.p1 GENE.c7587_g1_i1~~c7587_g1_i1.p1  ORF type:complete len:703 (+),score=188.36 c7587_g1_i1:32-2110(+)
MDDEDELKQLRKSSAYTAHHKPRGLSSDVYDSDIISSPSDKLSKEEKERQRQLHEQELLKYLPTEFTTTRIKWAQAAAPKPKQVEFVLPEKPGATTGKTNTKKSQMQPNQLSFASEEHSPVDSKPKPKPKPAVPAFSATATPPKPASVEKTPEGSGEQADDDYGPMPPAADSNDNNDDNDDDDSDHSSDEEEARDPIASIAPVSHVAEMKSHDKAVCALACDPAGARLISGSYDYQVSFWDFAGMTASLRSFRTFEPVEGHAVRAVDWSLSGDTFLIAVACQPSMYDRDGRFMAEYVKGYQYIADMSHTLGHVGPITSIQYHPTERSTFMTSSIDSTIRLWEPEDTKKQKLVVKCKNEKSTRVAVTSARYNFDGKLIYAGCQDGSIQSFDVRASKHRPQQCLRGCHTNMSEITSVMCTRDDRFLLSRATDDTLKIWDARRFQKPLRVFENLGNRFSETNIAISPNDSVFCTGVSVDDNEKGSLVFYDKATLSEKLRVPVSEGSVINVIWHRTLNQIFTGGSDKTVRCFYDPTRSQKGIMLAVGRKAKRHHIDDDEALGQRPIINPDGAMDDEVDPKKRRMKDRMDPIKSRNPEPPVHGPGVGGRVQASGLSKQLLERIGAANTAYLNEDPRESLLKYASVTQGSAGIVSAAYQNTQPVPIFDMTPYEEYAPEKGTRKEREQKSAGKVTWGSK